MGVKGSPTGRDLVIAVLIALGVAAALFMDTRIESRAYEPSPVVQWTGAADGPSTLAPNHTPSGPAGKTLAGRATEPRLVVLRVRAGAPPPSPSLRAPRDPNDRRPVLSESR